MTTWTCRLIDDPELNEYGNVDVSKREVGDMWFLDVEPDKMKDHHLTDQYFQENASRKPLVVVVPGGHYFLIDAKCYNAQRGFYDGWKVTGTPPLITVSPSINMEGRFHGFLENGVLRNA